MRIEAHVNDASGQEMIIKGSIAQKLDTGDVLRAMVLEITPDEALLRLSGGVVLKARLMETVNLKAGQFVELVVISKEGSTILLETAYNRHMAQRFDSETISDMLASLNIKSDDLNMRLAAEFIKNGIPVTRDKADEASRLIKSFTDLDTEKAAFLLSNEHKETEVAKHMVSRLLEAETGSGLLAKMLDGELKLGKLLADLQELAGDAGDAEAGGVEKTVDAGVILPAPGSDSKEPVENHGKTASGTFTGEVAVNTAKGTSASIYGETASINAPLKIMGGMETGDSVEKTVSGGNVENAGKGAEEAAGTKGYVAGAGNKAGDLHGKAAVGSTGGTPAGNTGTAPAGNAVNAYERTDSLAGYVEHFFLKIEGDKLEAYPAIHLKNPNPAEETGIGTALKKLTEGNGLSREKNDAAETLGAVKSSSRQNGQYTPAVAETVHEAVTLISGAIKLLNEFNYIGVPYLQIPVSINGYKTTAELFVMKRHKGGKRTDPNNLVMYISLDTKNMGRVETILDVKGKNVDIRLRTEEQQVSDYLRENIDWLYAGFSEYGYKLSDVEYTVIDSATPPSKLKKLVLGMAQAGWEHGRVDLRV